MTGYFTICPICGSDLFYHEDCSNCEETILFQIKEKENTIDAKTKEQDCDRLHSPSKRTL